MDQASEYAASEAFFFQKSRYQRGPCGPVTSLETVAQLQDDDEAWEEGELKLPKINLPYSSIVVLV